MKYETEYHVLYFVFVGCSAVFGYLIIAYGGGLMLGFLYGIVTIPLAFIMGIIPFIALTLVLTIPFYTVFMRILPTWPIASFFGSVVLALLLSVGLAWGGRLHLYRAGNELIAADVTLPVDFKGKNVLITNTRYPIHCYWPCAELLYLSEAKSVSLTKNTLIEKGKRLNANVTFELAPRQNAECYEEELSKFIQETLKKNDAALDLCIRKTHVPASDHQIYFEIRKDVVSGETESFNPFANAIVAKRTRIDDMSNEEPTTVFQYTSVRLLLPFVVLWPISIDRGSHTPAEKGLIRGEYTFKEPLDLNKLLFGHVEVP